MGEIMEQVVAGGPPVAMGKDRAELVTLATLVAQQTGLEWFNAGHSNDSKESPRFVVLYDAHRKVQVNLTDIPHDAVPSEEALEAVRRGADWEPTKKVGRTGYCCRVQVVPRSYWPERPFHNQGSRVKYLMLSLRHAVHQAGLDDPKVRVTLAAMVNNPDVEGDPEELYWTLALNRIACNAGLLPLSGFGSELRKQWSAQCAALLAEVESGSVAWTASHEKEHSDLVRLPKEPQS